MVKLEAQRTAGVLREARFCLEEKNAAPDVSSQKVGGKHQKDTTRSLGLEVKRKYDPTRVPEERNKIFWSVIPISIVENLRQKNSKIISKNISVFRKEKKGWGDSSLSLPSKHKDLGLVPGTACHAGLRALCTLCWL